MDENEKIIAYQKDVILCLRVQVESLRHAVSMLVRAMDNAESAVNVVAPTGYVENE